MNFIPNDEVFKKFSENARKILTNAQRIARDMNSSINSEHLLLAIVSTPGTISYELLQDHIVSVDQIRLILSLRGRESSLRTGISSFAKKIIEDAANLARKYNHSTIDVEHLLFGMVSNPDSLAYQIINRIGVDPTVVRRQLLKLFDELQKLDSISDEERISEDSWDGLKKMDQNMNMTFIPQEAVASRMNKLKKSALEYFANDLTKQAEDKKLDPVIGREQEIERVIQILARRTKNNPVLIGEPGVGKTAIVEGLAQRIADRNVPSVLADKKIYQLDLALLVAGTTFRGQFEERLKKLMAEIKNNSKIIIFLDELHTIVGAGSAEGSLDAANIIKPALAKGELRLIGATTLEEYRKQIEKDAALERRLQKVLVSETTFEETLQILNGIKKIYERFHNVKITDQALNSAIIYSQRFIQDRFLPDKAIDLIDEAASAANIKNMPRKSGDKILLQQLKSTVGKKEEALAQNDLKLAAKFRRQELELLAKYRKKNKAKRRSAVIIDEADISKIVTMWTGIPVGKIVKQEQERLRHLDVELSKYVIGQKNAIQTIAATIKRAKTGVSNPNKPLGSFIFLGPTGVGKTYLTQVLAKTVYGSESALIKIDMSEFMERHNASRLIGAPPGYVGYDETGRLTDSIRRKPFSVVLFDEIEKAHPEILNLLLQILEDGNLTDGTGKKVSFKHSIVVMTSNIGSELLTKNAAIGFNKQKNSSYKDLQADIGKELENHLKPELVNRLDKIIFFEPLSKSSIEKIVRIEFKELSNRLKEEGYKLKFSQKLVKYIASKSYNPNYGARPIKRTITELIEDKLADTLLASDANRNSEITLDFVDNKIVVKNNTNIKNVSGKQKVKAAPKIKDG